MVFETTKWNCTLVLLLALSIVHSRHSSVCSPIKHDHPELPAIVAVPAKLPRKETR